MEDVVLDDDEAPDQNRLMNHEDRCRQARSELYSMWRLQEHLLHVYHSIFIPLNSVLLAVVTFWIGALGDTDMEVRFFDFTFPSGRTHIRAIAPVMVRPEAPGSVDLIPVGVIAFAMLLCLGWLYLYWDRALAASFFPRAIEALEQRCETDDLKCLSSQRALQTPFVAFKAARKTPEGSIHLLHPIESFRGIRKTQFTSKPRMILGGIPLLTLCIWAFLAYLVLR